MRGGLCEYRPHRTSGVPVRVPLSLGLGGRGGNAHDRRESRIRQSPDEGPPWSGPLRPLPARRAARLRTSRSSSSRRTTRGAATCTTRPGSTARCSAARVPMVVTVHDVVALKRRGEYLRAGLRSEAALPRGPARHARDRPNQRRRRRRDQRARRSPASGSSRSPRPPRPLCTHGPHDEVARVRERFDLPDQLPAVGRRSARPRPAQAGDGAGRARRGRCRSCSSARPASGHTSCPT